MTPAGIGHGFTIPGPAGRIECLLREPDGEPRFAAAICHPHPLYGGTMHNRVVFRTAKRLAACGGAAMRFNFRGVGLTAGSHDDGRGETDDLVTVLDHLIRAYPDLPLVVAGYSFGAWVALEHGARDGRVEALIGIGVATTIHTFVHLPQAAAPKLFVQGAMDEFGGEAAIRAFVAGLAEPKELVVVPGADHLFTSGGTDRVEAAVEAFACRLFPGS